jgi:uncharacterized membrane protein YeaQ/YmgE (transglycosylase-associated protein family)
MADNPSKLGALLTWVGGIVGTVIAGVLVYHFTIPQPPVQVGLNGFVENVVTQQPVVGALVTADLGSQLASQPTDYQGRYAFIMNTTKPPAQTINVDVLIRGYQRYTATVRLTGGDTFAGIALQPVAVTPAPGYPPHLLPKPALILHIPKNYAMRADTATLKPK